MTRTVVITGATSGIGRAAAREFARRGDRLVLAARSPATLAEVREECRAAGAPVGVSVCLVNPGSVDTPVYQQAANHLGRVGRPPLPIATPVRVARAIVNCADRPRREISVGGLNVIMRFGFTVLPGLYDVLVGPLMRLAGLSNRPVAPHEGIIFTPDPAGESVRGGWLPELSQVVRSVGGTGATVGSAVRRLG